MTGIQIPEIDEVERIIRAARSLTKCADEFWPAHPYAIEEYLDALIVAVAEKPSTALKNDKSGGEHDDELERARRAIQTWRVACIEATIERDALRRELKRPSPEMIEARKELFAQRMIEHPERFREGMFQPLRPWHLQWWTYTLPFRLGLIRNKF